MMWMVSTENLEGAQVVDLLNSKCNRMVSKLLFANCFQSFYNLVFL